MSENERFALSIVTIGIGICLSVGILSIGAGISYDYIKTYFNSSDNIDPEKKKLAIKLQRPDIEQIDFNSYELLISRDIVASDEIDVNFSDIGGMEKEKEDIFDNIIFPIQYWIEAIKTGKQNLINCPSGLLLYGNPGTGKTMLAKAIAKEAKVSFLQVKPSTILDKYVGESEKLITSIFSLAHKIAPCIIFIDEMDTLLRQRTSMNNSNPVSAALGVFLSEWDGLSTKLDSPVVVLGSTNRPADIDPAFIRRMPLVIKVLNPDANAREQILKCILRKEGTLSDCIDLSLIANTLEGFTGSDLKEVCRLASINRMKRIMKQNKNEKSNNNEKNNNNNTESILDQNHQLINEDFDIAVSRMFTIRENHSDEKRQNLLEAFLNSGIK